MDRWLSKLQNIVTNSKPSYQLYRKIAKNGCEITKTIPDNTIHFDSLQVFLGIFPYIIAQGTSRFECAAIKLVMNNGISKGMKNKHPELYKTLRTGFKCSFNYYGQMMLQRSKLIERWETFFQKYDFLLCLVAFGPAFKRCKRGNTLIYDDTDLIYMEYVLPYTAPFNASGNPALAIPLGLGKEGLPVGVQIVGKYWSEP